jgi:hypothetical protein
MDALCDGLSLCSTPVMLISQSLVTVLSLQGACTPVLVKHMRSNLLTDF